MAVRAASLRARLTVTTLLVSTITAALLVIGVQVFLGRSNDATAHSRLASRAAAAAATVARGPDGVRVLEQQSPYLDQNVWIFDTEGVLIDGRDPHGSVPPTVRALSTVEAQRELTVGEVRYLGTPVVKGGSRVATVVAAEDLEPYEAAERDSLWLTLLLAAASVTLATTAAWVSASRSLRQVQAMADTADDWREHELSARFDPGPGGDEIAHLGRTLDQMLDRIVEAMSAERRLTDEIAHELRTPLTVILGEAELGQRTATDAAARESLGAIRQAARQMRDSIDTMLAAARAHAGQGDLTTVGAVLAEIGQPPSPCDDVCLGVASAPVVAALRPLLDNAERHGGGRPRVVVVRDAGSVVLAVLDDGPGVDAADLETVFEPGHTTVTDGSGLGLPLARRMARAAGGDLVARPGPGGRFELRLPTRDPEPGQGVAAHS